MAINPLDTLDASLASQVGELLRARQMKLATAESCTGGLLGDLITSVPGSSDYYVGGVIAYAYQAKTALLDIPQKFLLQYGAVSQETARAMARGVRERLNADIAVSLTGILGPGGGMPNKPVGLVFIALLAPGLDRCEHFIWNETRRQNKLASANAALTLLLDYLGGLAS
ncbi:MAG: CinA family protein [Anaerolineae bacterium]